MKDEYLDVVDEQDNVIGKASKKEALSKNLLRRIVHILIFNKKDELLLQKRSKSVSFCPLFWSTSVGGHVQSGETYEQAARRELIEELGIDIPFEFAFKDIYQGPPEYPSREILTIFKTYYEGLFKPDKDDLEKVEFFSLDKIQQMIKKKEKFHPELLFLLKKYYKIH